MLSSDILEVLHDSRIATCHAKKQNYYVKIPKYQTNQNDISTFVPAYEIEVMKLSTLCLYTSNSDQALLGQHLFHTRFSKYGNYRV